MAYGNSPVLVRQLIIKIPRVVAWTTLAFAHTTSATVRDVCCAILASDCLAYSSSSSPSPSSSSWSLVKKALSLISAFVLFLTASSSSSRQAVQPSSVTT
ncbi:hypothetical protein T492DRAFT_41640 [Pavlovales sp. CCMP2436]|nr:hypothetical protein T492DRAFT_41640 [Pavlovales sp. CCMP2436]